MEIVRGSYESIHRVERALCILQHEDPGGIGFKIDLRQICEPVVNTATQYFEHLVLRIRHRDGDGRGVVGRLGR